MNTMYKETIQGISTFCQGVPDELNEAAKATLRSRVYRVASGLIEEGFKNFEVRIGTSYNSETPFTSSTDRENTEQRKNSEVDQPVEIRSRQYEAQAPLYAFDQLIVPDTLMEDLLSAVEVIKVEKKVFDEWGLRKIEPYPRTALNLFGPPGTGKTLAAHAIAHNLGRAILPASYAEIESKFHGDGPKNVKAIFYAAERDKAVLFIDEADSLLSKRLTEVTQGSEQAINSMRSQLFICLQEFRGVVIFATNLVENYDKAFETRVRNLKFMLPDEKCRREIWRAHLVSQLPQAESVSIDQLAIDTDDICGRDIKNAVIDAAVRVARHNKEKVEQSDLIDAIDRIKRARADTNVLRPQVLNKDEKREISAKIQASLTREHAEEKN